MARPETERERQRDCWSEYRVSYVEFIQNDVDFWFYLADIQRIEEDPIQEVLQTQKHHLYGRPVTVSFIL